MTFSPNTQSLQLLPVKYNEFSSFKCFIEKSQIQDNSLISDQEILGSIHEQYLDTDKSFDASRFELCKVPESYSSKDIEVHCKNLIRQHHIISKKLLHLILQKQSKCNEEFDRIVRIQKHLMNTYTVCKLCRNNLNLATQQFTSSSLQILYYFRKRKILESILKILYSIKVLCRMKGRLKQYLTEENYPKVISLISECQTKARIYRNYDCIAALHNNLVDTLEQVEDNLDLSLSKICNNFDISKYESIQDAYIFLGKSQTAIDQLHLHFTAAIHNTAYNCVLKYAEENSRKPYNFLCQSISLTNFLSCLIELCKSLLTILKSYYLIIKWHNNSNEKFIKNASNNMNSNYEYVLQKLKNGIIKICNDIENKIMVYLDGFNLTLLKFEEFIQALNVIDKITKIEKNICKMHLSKLNEYTKEKFIGYFNIYHASRLDELRNFLENDGWKTCPVKHSFKPTQLQEFKSFKCILDASYSRDIGESSFTDVENNQLSPNCIDELTLSSDIVLIESAEEDILQHPENIYVNDLTEDSEDDEIPEELKYDYVDEMSKSELFQKKKQLTGPIVTNTTLRLLRICGKYLQVTRFFREYNKIVVQYIIQIFELYFYTIYNFFTTDIQIDDLNITQDTHVKRTISRIKDNLIFDNEETMTIAHLNHKVQPPTLSSMVDLNDSSKLFGLAERIVAAESLIFLGKQYELFRSYLNSILFHQEEQNQLNQFYTQTISSTVLLRKPIYMASVSRYFNIIGILNLMSKVDWELKEVVSQHNGYIDFLVEEIQKFKAKLVEIQNFVCISEEVYEAIWESAAHLIAYTFVEGFSNVKKCSNGGRALMQLDFTQFISKFETITALRPMPYQDYVTAYIKAFYLPETNLESWIKTHSEYTPKHLIGLISSMYQNKKMKQKLITFIEDQRMNR